MALIAVTFGSASDFINYVDQTINEIKSTLGNHMNQVEEIRQRYEKVKKRHETIKRLLSGKKEIGSDAKQLEVAGFKVLINPSAEYELSLLENVVSSLQEKLNAFEKTKELLPLLKSEEDMRISMVLDDGIPSGFMLYVEEK
jgi:alanyl-tRNA synthetase